MNLKSLSNQQLLENTKLAVKIETGAVTNVVRHFVEISQRDLYLELGFGSMFALATKKYGYDKPSAQRRVAAMELALAHPSVLTKIDERKLCLQTTADIQKFLNHERGKKRPYSYEQAQALIEKCTGLSSRKVQIELATRSPSIDFGESKRHISKDRLRVSHTISVAIEAKLERVRQLRSHANPYMSREDLMDFLAELALDQIDPVRKAARAEKRKKKKAQADGTVLHSNVHGDESKMRADRQRKSDFDHAHTSPERRDANNLTVGEEIVGECGEVQLVAIFKDEKVPAPELACTESPEERSRYIPAEESHALWQNAQATGCDYTDAVTGQRCGSVHQTQRDHITEYSRGGSNAASNLQTLCAKHNRFRWRQRANSYVRTRRAEYC